MVIQHLKQIEYVKSLTIELTKCFKKKVILSCYPLLSMQQQAVSWADCYMLWIVYHNWRWPPQCLDWDGAPKHVPKPHLHSSPGLLPFWSCTAFWTLVKPLHLRNMLSKSKRGTKICNLQVILVNRTGPVLFYNNVKCYIYLYIYIYTNNSKIR